MTISFTEVMNTAIASMETRMDELHDKYMHLFEEAGEQDQNDVADLVNDVIYHMTEICDRVEAAGEKILARRNSPPPPPPEESTAE